MRSVDCLRHRVESRVFLGLFVSGFMMSFLVALEVADRHKLFTYQWFIE